MKGIKITNKDVYKEIEQLNLKMEELSNEIKELKLTLSELDNSSFKK